MKSKDVCREIERRGGVAVRQKGSHRRYAVRYGAGAAVYATVPMKKGDLPEGTWKSIQRMLEPAFGERWLRR